MKEIYLLVVLKILIKSWFFWLTFSFEIDDQAFDDAVVLDVFGENFFHVFFGLRGIPDIIGVDDHRGALRAGIEAPGFVDPHFAFETAVVDTFFEMVQKVE